MFTRPNPLIRIALTLALSLASLAAESRDWTRDAIRLTGESDFVRGIAIQNLRRTPKIQKILLHELHGPRKALALDVIAALKIRRFLPILLQQTKDDDSGQICLTIDSLVTEQNIPNVKRTYQDRVLCPGACQTPEPARLVMLESLTRMGAELPADSLKNNFAASSFEVKSAILRYVRRRLQNRDERYLPIVFTALGSQPYQIRLQAVYLMRELKLGGRGLALNYVCARDPRPEVRAYCREIQREAK